MRVFTLSDEENFFVRGCK